MKNKAKGRVRDFLAANVNAKMTTRYRVVVLANGEINNHPSETARINAMAEESGVGRRTIQRILHPDRDDHDVQLGTIEDLAKVLRCEVQDLLRNPAADSA